MAQGHKRVTIYKRDNLWVQSPLKEMKYQYFYFFASMTLSSATRNASRVLRKVEKRSDLTLGSRCLPRYMQDLS